MTTWRRGNARVWTYRPQWYWRGWWTLIPVGWGFDEYGRRTVVLGWTITGRVAVAWWTCKCADCDGMRAETAAWEAELARPADTGDQT